MSRHIPAPRYAGLFSALLICLLAALFAWPGRAAAERSHPFLFLTRADVERARLAIRKEKAFARLDQQLMERARAVQPEELPLLERDWWEAARQKPWAETYPEVFHHTWMVPLKWAAAARTCAQAGLLHPKSEFSAVAKTLLLDLAGYSFEFEHFDVGMNYTVWTVAALEAYDILYDRFSPEERARMDAFFHRYLAAVQKNDDYWVKHEPGGKLNNHYAWHKLGLAMIGLFYEQPELVEQALHGPKGAWFMMQHGFRDDGLWLEGSIPYQFAATSALLRLAEILENCNYRESLWRDATADGMSLKQSYDALIPLVFPDGTLPPVGDAYARRPHLGEYADWEILYQRLGDPKYAWLLASRKERVPQVLFQGQSRFGKTLPPPQTTRLWPEMGYAALRSVEGTNYWSGKGWTVFATYSSRPVHNHADKLSVMLFADAHLWLPDLEAKTAAEHAFSSQVQSRLNRETVCHNTLLVDGQSQRFPGRSLDLLEYRALPEGKRLTMGDLSGQLYPGVRQSRTLIVREDYVLDFFQVQSAEPHEFTWLVHVDGNPAESSVRDWRTVTFPTNAPWLYLKSPKQSATESSGFGESFEHDGKRLRLDLLADGPMEIAQCGFPRDDGKNPETIPMRLLRRRGTPAWWLAVYRLNAKREHTLELRARPAILQSFELEIILAGRRDVHIVPALDRQMN